MFGMLKKVVGAGAREVKAEYGESKDFLEAVCAAGALVAAADGDIADAEKRKVVTLITGHAALSKLYPPTVIEQTSEAMFKRAKEGSGRQQLARELDDIKNRPNGGQMAEDVYLIAKDVAFADGDIGEKEAEVLKKIAARLQVDESKFDF